MTIRVLGGRAMGYVKDSPVLQINHQISQNEFETLAHILGQAYGADKVLAGVHRALGVAPSGADGAEYYCSVEGMHAPRLAHRTLQAATVEAERLANLSPGRKVLILEAKGYRQVEVTKVMKGAN